MTQNLYPTILYGCNYCTKLSDDILLREQNKVDAWGLLNSNFRAKTASCFYWHDKHIRPLKTDILILAPSMETFPHYWPFVRGIHRSPIMQSFDVSFDVSLRHLLNKQSMGRWIKIFWWPFDVAVMLHVAWLFRTRIIVRITKWHPKRRLCIKSRIIAGLQWVVPHQTKNVPPRSLLVMYRQLPCLAFCHWLFV